MHECCLYSSALAIVDEHGLVTSLSAVLVSCLVGFAGPRDPKSTGYFQLCRDSLNLSVASNRHVGRLESCLFMPPKALFDAEIKIIFVYVMQENYGVRSGREGFAPERQGWPIHRVLLLRGWLT